MKSLVFFASLAVFNAAPGNNAPPESVGMSSERLDRVAPLIQRSIEDKYIPGAVTLVARRGSIVHLQSHGLGIAGEGAMTTDAIFLLTSMTKPIAHVAAMMLVEDGKLLLDDPLSDYIPAFKDAKVKLPSSELVPANNPIRIHHLLRHNSGVSTTEKRHDTFPTLEAHIDEVAKLPLQFHPGERYKYPESTEVLGRVIEIASKQTLRQFMMERIFKPLSMMDTDFGIPDNKLDRQAVLFYEGKTDVTRGGRYPDGARLTNYYSARGGLHATATDYWKFCQMILNQEKS